MPFKSKKQETYLRINEPEIYQKWKRRYGLYQSAETFTPQSDSEVYQLMESFESAGYEILLVGGVVRDTLLGYSPADFDFSTDATPNEVAEVVDAISNYKYIRGAQGEQAKRALTSLVLSPSGEVFEITTYRADLGYENGNRARPIAVPAKSFKEDAARRDITINSMGMTKEGKIIDYMGGLEDLNKGIIKAVGNPKERFTEDPLRMIRALRYSTRFDFPIEAVTYDTIVEYAPLVNSLSGRRLRTEIGKVLIQPHGYEMLMETGILPILMPEFRNMEQYQHRLEYHPEGSLYNHYIEVFKEFTKIPDRTELGAWALLFHDIAKPQTAEWNEEGGYHTFYGHDKQGAQLVLENYNNSNGPFEFSKRELQAIAWTTDHHLGKFWEMKKPMKVSTMRNDDSFPLLVEVIKGDMMGIRRGGEDQLQVRLKEINEITDKVEAQKAKAGNRPKGFAQQVIQQLNVQGKEISEVLAEIEEMVATGRVKSYEEALAVLKSEKSAETTPFIEYGDITIKSREFDDSTGRMEDVYEPVTDPEARKRWIGRIVYDRFRRKGKIVDEGWAKENGEIAYKVWVIKIDGGGYIQVFDTINYYLAYPKFDTYGILWQPEIGGRWTLLGDSIGNINAYGMENNRVSFPSFPEDNGPDFSKHNWKRWMAWNPATLEEWARIRSELEMPRSESQHLIRNNKGEYLRRRQTGLYGGRNCDYCNNKIDEELMGEMREHFEVGDAIYTDIMCRDCAEESSDADYEYLWEFLEEETEKAWERENNQKPHFL